MYQFPNQILFCTTLLLTYIKLFSLILKDSCNIGKYRQSQSSVEKRTTLSSIFFFNEKWTPSRRLDRSVISAAPISCTSMRRISRHNLSNRYLCKVDRCPKIAGQVTLYFSRIYQLPQFFNEV